MNPITAVETRRHRWTRAGGREMAGLVKRRQAEYQMCIGGVE
jgi:GH24 family phage-related lysozyme (muramidase)